MIIQIHWYNIILCTSSRWIRCGIHPRLPAHSSLPELHCFWMGGRILLCQCSLLSWTGRYHPDWAGISSQLLLLLHKVCCRLVWVHFCHWCARSHWVVILWQHLLEICFRWMVTGSVKIQSAHNDLISYSIGSNRSVSGNLPHCHFSGFLLWLLLQMLWTEPRQD